MFAAASIELREVEARLVPLWPLNFVDRRQCKVFDVEAYAPKSGARARVEGEQS